MHADKAAPSSGPGRILLGVFETLDRAGIPYCVLHGYENYPQRIKSDVDAVIGRAVSLGHLLAVLHQDRECIGAEVVRCRGYYIVLAGKDADGSLCFLELDLSVDCTLDDVRYYDGPEVLASRRRHRQFWIPAANVAFGCYLARTIAKGTLDDRRTQRLTILYKEDPERCAQEVSRFWGVGNADVVCSAAQSEDWQPVRRHLAELRAELRTRAILRHPERFVASKLRRAVDRLGRIWRPDGVAVVLLGPDGAGKSSVIEALGVTLTSAFARWTCWGFAPSIRQLLGRPSGSTNQPHALPARSFLISLVRASYWLAYYTFGYVRVRLALVRSTLVLYDRHFVDILVDSKRYRYGGPSWLLPFIWRLIPKPDLIVLLNAPPQVLQARKQEVPFEETARQLKAYLSLVRSMKNAHIVNAAQPLEDVAADVTDIILRHLTTRIGNRVGLAQLISAPDGRMNLNQSPTR